MSSAWTAFDFKRQLIAEIEKVLSVDPPEVRVFDFVPPPEDWSTDVIVIGHRMRDEEVEKNALGNNRQDERVELECQIRVIRPGAGSDVAREAEDRLRELLDVVAVQIRERETALKVGDQTLRATLSGRDAATFAWMSSDSVPARLAIVDFVVSYLARVSAS